MKTDFNKILELANKMKVFRNRKSQIKNQK